MSVKCPNNHEPYRIMKHIGQVSSYKNVYWCQECGSIVTLYEDEAEFVIHSPMVYLDQCKKERESENGLS